MAKFVIAGKSDCPYYAKAELLGDSLSTNIPNFNIHKIVKDPKEWDNWLKDVCAKNNWTHTKSPLIWREVVNRGGKGMYLGDANDFQEYAKNYYNIVSELTSDDLKKISIENEKTCKKDEEERVFVLSTIDPLNLTISNPESPIFYFIINEILNDKIFGSRDIFVRLYSKKESKNLEGLRMEVVDLASDSLRNIKVVHNVEEAFKNCDFAILLDELEPDHENDKKFFNPYIKLAKDIDEYAKPTCKILISPFNSRNEIYALVNLFSYQLKKINPKKNLIGNSMCDEMLAKAVLAHRLNVNSAYVSNVLVFGQSFVDSFYIDLTYARVTDYEGAVWATTNTHWLNLMSMIADVNWVNKEFMNLVHERENLISEHLKRKAILTFSQSVVKLTRLWNLDHSDDNSIYSAIVYAKGNYSIKEDVFLSVPVKFEKGSFYSIKNFLINSDAHSILTEIVEDTKRRISTNYKEEIFEKDGHEIKLSIPHVIFSH